MSDNLPLVTVITATFNLVKNERVDFFRQSVESVHAQDYPNIEHLVIDGASSDGTLDIIHEYELKGWLTCHSEPDKGIYDAMNKGVRLAKGKYVVFLNSDDYWHGERGVSASVKALEETGAVLSYADRNVVTEEGELMWEEYADVGVFLHQMPFCHQTVFTKRDTLLQYNGFDFEAYKSAADYDLITRIILGGEPVVYVPCNFTSFRFGGFSTTIAELSERDCDKIRESHIPGCTPQELRKGYINARQLRYVMHRVHISVSNSLLAAYTRLEPGLYKVTTGLVKMNGAGDMFTDFSLRVSSQPTPTLTLTYKSKIRLLLLLPFLYERKQERARFTFFGLPLLTVRYRNNMQSAVYRLFGFIPLFRRVNRGDGKTRKFYIFGLPVLKLSTSTC